ncbi:MAG: HypC/HybG/HupF family hydrogenase formation chaperone [Acidobacteriota bacterium]
MCLAFPAKIIELDGLNAVVEYHNVKRDIRVDLVGDCNIGEYVLVHAGFAINKLDEEAAKETMETWDELIRVMEEEDNKNSPES